MISRVLLLLLIAPAVSHAVDLVLVENASPTSGVVRLADVAAILNAGGEDIQRLGSLPLMPSPVAGSTHNLPAQSIRDLLEAHGIDLSNVRFRGAAQVRLSRAASPAVARATQPEKTEAASVAPPLKPIRPTRRSTGFRHVGSARSAVKPRAPKKLRLNSRRRQLVVDGLTKNLTKYVQVQSGDVMLHVMSPELKDHNAATLAAHDADIRISSTGALQVGKMRFLIEFTTPTGDVKFPVYADVVEARPAVIVRREIRRGMQITAADVHIAPLPIAFRPRGAEQIAQDLNEVIGKEATKRLKAGDVLTDLNSLPPVMVHRGESVTVSAARGVIRVKTLAKARKSGRLGEFIEVETLDSRERFDARVIGRGKLAVLSAGGDAVKAVASRVNTLRK